MFKLVITKYNSDGTEFAVRTLTSSFYNNVKDIQRLSELLEIDYEELEKKVYEMGGRLEPLENDENKLQIVFNNRPKLIQFMKYLEPRVLALHIRSME